MDTLEVVVNFIYTYAVTPLPIWHHYSHTVYWNINYHQQYTELMFFFFVCVSFGFMGFLSIAGEMTWHVLQSCSLWKKQRQRKSTNIGQLKSLTTLAKWFPSICFPVGSLYPSCKCDKWESTATLKWTFQVTSAPTEQIRTHLIVGHLLDQDLISYTCMESLYPSWLAVWQMGIHCYFEVDIPGDFWPHRTDQTSPHGGTSAWTWPDLQ